MPSATSAHAPPSLATRYWEDGRLTEAIAAAEAVLRVTPLDEGSRRFLVELLCFSGDLDRAERQLDILLGRTSRPPVGYALLRNLIFGERSRRAVEEGHEAPHMAGDAPTLGLKLLMLQRGGMTGAGEAMPGNGPPLRGTAEGARFAGFRDLDDVFAAVFEVITPDGRLVWLDMRLVDRLMLPKPERARDLLWRPVEVYLANGATLQGFMPALYVGSHLAESEALRLGHETDWRSAGEGQPVRGVGLRLFGVDETVRTVLEPGELCFER